MSRYPSNAVRLLRLRHPIGGIRRGRAYQDQEPFTTPRARNVFPADGLTGRDRVGQRPGAKLLFPQQLGSGNPVRLLSSVSRILSTPPQRFTDGLDTALDASLWDTKPSGGSATGTYDSINGGISAADALHTPLDLDTTKPYAVEVDFTRPITGAAPDSYNQLEIWVHLRYANATPLLADSTHVKFVVYGESGGSASCVLEFYENGALLGSTITFGITTAEAASGTLRVTMNEGGTLKKVVVNVAGVDRGNVTLTAANSNTKQRFGLFVGRGSHTPPDALGVATELRFIYTAITPAASATSMVLIASSNAKLYADNPGIAGSTTLAGNLTEISQPSNALTLSTTRRLMAAELLQKSYIADHDTSRYISPGGGTVNVSTTGAVTAGPDWTQRGISLLDDVAIVLNPSAGVNAGVYKLTSITSTTLQLAGYTTGTAGTATIRIERAMKIYDPSVATNPLSIWLSTPGKGLVPHGCTAICRYQNSMLLGADPQAPHVWYMSRRDNPLDFYYTDSDKGRAMSGTSTGQSTIGNPITALISFWSDYAVMATSTSLLLMRGDPRRDGQLEEITRKHGIIDRFAWCQTSEADLVYLAFDGLHRYQAGASSKPEDLSAGSLPQELQDLDPALIEISMEYDVRERGILITLTPKNGGIATHWFFHLKTASFWEVTFPAAAQPCLQHVLNSDNPVLRSVALGCRDGYVRTLNRAQYFDDVPALAMASKRIVSYCQYGPFGPAGGGGRDNSIAAMLHFVQAQLAAGSGPIAFSVYAAMDAESCIRATTPFKVGAFASTADAKRSIRRLVQARGGAFIIELAGADTTGASTWAVEGLDAGISRAGESRVVL